MAAAEEPAMFVLVPLLALLIFVAMLTAFCPGVATVLAARTYQWIAH